MRKETLTLFQRDLLLGFSAIRYRWISSMVLFVIILTVSLYQLKLSSKVEGFSNLGYTDLLFVLFKGTEYPVIDDPNPKFPFSWLIIQMIGPFILGGYVREDFFDQSSFLFVRAKRRLSLWLSKLLFSSVIVISMYLFIITVIVLISFFFLTFSTDWSEYGSKVIKPFMSTHVTPFAFSMNILLLPFLTTMLTVIVQAVMTVFIRTIYVFTLILGALVISVFCSSRWLPGSYSMILRHRFMDAEQGFVWGTAIIYTVSLLIIVVCCGYILFKNRDIFPKEKD